MKKSSIRIDMIASSSKKHPWTNSTATATFAIYNVLEKSKTRIQ
jgi:hypothetical protein